MHFAQRPIYEHSVSCIGNPVSYVGSLQDGTILCRVYTCRFDDR